MLNINERSFKQTMTKIGVAMLIFLGLFNVLFLSLGLVFSFIEGSLASDVIYEIIYTLFYLASFIVPALILNLMMGKDKKPLMLDKKIPHDVVAYIFAAISIVLVISYINFIIVDLFDYSEFSSDAIWGDEPLANYEIVLMFMTTAIAPAFAEELLFRGAILSALKPYGKMPSIFISAILFAFMHQNIEQLLYTFAAGLVLAWAVYETGSIWSGILIHLFNNLLSVVTTPIFDRLSESTASTVSLIIEICIFGLGILSVIYLFIRNLTKKKSRAKIPSGIYGVPVYDLENNENLIQRKVKTGKLIKYFFSPTIIVFLVMSILTMVLLIFESILYNSGVL